MNDVATASRTQPLAPLSRLLSCIRVDEVLVLQGSPLIGACYSIGALTSDKLVAAAALGIGSLCLVAHVFLFNDWSGVAGDLKDPNRATRTFHAKGVNRAEVGILAAVLLGLSLLLFGFLGALPFGLALAIAGLSALYSGPALHIKGLPFFNSAFHLVGGALHFLLGYGTFAAIDGRGIAMASFFGLVFAGGHLMHEVRDRDGDQSNGIRTNAVAFGKACGFAAGLTLFTLAYALLVSLAAFEVIPRVLLLAGALYPLHLGASLRAWRAGLDVPSLLRLQRCYRLLYAVIGIAMVATTLPSWGFSLSP
jgi:4-hydroxybenzoate polyprenyltransferase